MNIVSEEPKLGQSAYVAGWGMTKEGATKYANAFREIRLPIQEKFGEIDDLK